jgi:hypothetical protein
MWKTLRIFVLLVVLATVAQSAWLGRSRAVSWRDPLRVAIFPINGDGSDASAKYLRALTKDSFHSVETYLDNEAARHDLGLRHPVEIDLAQPVTSLPPPAPRQASAVEAISWSLRMRYWAWRNDTIAGPKPHVRLFVLFFDPASHERLPHSIGLEKGLLGVINAFASPAMAGSNKVIVAHELLHALGATDKYDSPGNQPRYPDGYAEPERSPRHPQDFAELMGGRIPISATQAEIPQSLDQTLIGPRTAAEIGWRKTP